MAMRQMIPWKTHVRKEEDMDGKQANILMFIQSLVTHVHVFLKAKMAWEAVNAI